LHLPHTSSTALWCDSIARDLRWFAVRCLMFLEIVVKNGTLLTKSASKHRTTFSCFSINSGGMPTWSLTTGAGFHLVVLPFRLATSGPQIFSAMSTSSSVIGQLAMPFILRIVLRSAMDGHPVACSKLQAVFALEICHCE